MKTAAGLLLLLVLLAGEVLLWKLTHLGRLLPLYGVVMAVLVAVVFMRLPRMPALAIVFAMAGVFWLCVMLGLGMVDPLTRHDVVSLH